MLQMVQSSLIRPLSLVTLLICAALAVVTSALELSSWGWDFLIYREACDAWQRGLNPYEMGTGSFAFHYPPLYLPLYCLTVSWPVFLAAAAGAAAATVFSRLL
jgi:hypothetical protein